MALNIQQKQAVAKARARKRQAQQQGGVNAPEQELTTLPASTTGKAFGEAALAIGTGIPTEIVSGLLGISEGVRSFVTGGDDPAFDAAQRIERARREGIDLGFFDLQTRQPTTPEGKAATDLVARVFEPITDFAKASGQAALNLPDDEGEEIESRFIRTAKETGERIGPSPAIATAVQTGIEAGPAGIGLRRPRMSMRQRAEEIRNLERSAERLQLDMGSGRDTLRGQIKEAAERETRDIATAGETFPELRDAIVQARNRAKNQTNKLFEQARSKRAGIPVSEVPEFRTNVRQALDGFDVDQMNIVSKRLGEIDRLANLPEGSSVKVRAIHDFRKRLNRSRAPKTDTSQNLALDTMKGLVDDFLESKFNADMVTGDPSSIAVWREAINKSADMKAAFDDNKTIRQLRNQEATAKEMKNWVLGASTVGAKGHAANVVKRIKGIVGEDSPRMEALRQEALLDVMDPILREQPNYSQFVKNYDKFIRNNKELANELFPESQNALSELRKFAASAERLSPQNRPKLVDIPAIGAVAMFGHGIAQAGMRVRLAKKAFELMGAAKNRSAKNQLMSDILDIPVGFFRGESLLPVGPSAPAAVGAEQASERLRGNENQQPANTQ